LEQVILRTRDEWPTAQQAKALLLLPFVAEHYVQVRLIHRANRVGGYSLDAAHRNAVQNAGCHSLFGVNLLFRSTTTKIPDCR
jgi:hypothetical protein